MKALVFSLVMFLVFPATVLHAQEEEISKAIMKHIGKIGAKKKAELDSVDFQFAISVNQNAGLIDVRQKGEGLTRGLYGMVNREDKSASEIARDSIDFALNLYNLKFYKLAESSFLDAKNFMETSGLMDDISYLRCLSALGLVYLAQGRTYEARDYIDWALESSKALGERSPTYVANLNSKAKLHQMLGQYNEAEKGFDECLTLARDVFGVNSLQYAILLNNKAILYQNVGRFAEAEELMKQAISTANNAFKKALKRKNSYDSRRFQTNLAFLYQVSGKFNEAESVFLDMKRSYERNLASGNHEYAMLLNQLAVLYIQMKKNDQVEPLLAKAIEILKKKQGEKSPAYAQVVSDMGNFYRITGRNKEATTFLTRALEIRKEVLGTDHPDYVRSQEDMAILFWKNGQWDEAYSLYKAVMDKTISFINQYFPPMSEAEKTKYWDITFPRFQRYYNFALEALPEKPSIAVDVFDYQTATKALLLNTTNKIRQTILDSGDRNLINDYLGWLDKKEALAQYYSLSQEELLEQKIDLKALEAEANRMERSLSARSSAFSSGYSMQKIPFSQIRDRLADQEAVVEIIRVQQYDHDFTDESKYLVLVLEKGLTTPKAVVLDNGKQLESRYVRFYRNAIQQRVEDNHSYDQFWGRIEPLLQGKKRIYLSPDGVFNQINVNTLKKPSGEYLIGQYDVVILGNSKDLIKIKEKKSQSTVRDAILIGYPEYGGGEIAELPGTRVEVEAISDILTKGGYKTNRWMQRQATEKNLKSVKSPSLMHIATHGYFLQDAASQPHTFGVNIESAGNNPLLRSGLLLAGAGNTVTGTGSTDLQSYDNGILTAYEAMNLNLDNTELIVLSACETGLGDVKNGEGVYGLQRAFLVAGAEALIMSLWKVDDAATQQLMSGFYSNWIKLGDKQKAFKQAQLQLMNQHKDPYFWGAFVMMGQ